MYLRVKCMHWLDNEKVLTAVQLMMEGFRREFSLFVSPQVCFSRHTCELQPSCKIQEHFSSYQGRTNRRTVIYMSGCFPRRPQCPFSRTSASPVSVLQSVWIACVCLEICFSAMTL